MLPLLLACAPEGTLGDVDVTAATLADVTLFHAGAVLGVETGGATLEVQTADGDALEVPVTLSGPRLGLMVDAAFGWGMVDLPLVWFDGTGVGGTVPGSDLLGTYGGLEYSAAAGVGVHYGSLTNEAGVWMALNTLEVGAAGSVNYVWLTVAESEQGLP